MRVLLYIRGLALPAVFGVALMTLLAAGDAAPADAKPRMPRITVKGDRLHAGARPWRAWGFNWGVGHRQPILDYFDDPSAQHLRRLSRQMRTARQLGANSMRVYLEVGQVMRSPTEPNRRTIRALGQLLDLAEDNGIYLNITGNLVWRPAKAPAWYDGMPDAQRWRVQQRLWRAIAAEASTSPAVMCYELASEPFVGERNDLGYYLGHLEGFTFAQAVAMRNGGDNMLIARQWTKTMATTVRGLDDRPVTIGLLPLTDGPFGFQNVADLLDIITVHEYVTPGQVSKSVGLISNAARFSKPVLLGETFDFHADGVSQPRFLKVSAPMLTAGVLGFFDGREPENVQPRTLKDRAYRESLEHMYRARAHLLDTTSSR